MQICMGCKQDDACANMQAQNFQNSNPAYTQCRPEPEYTDSVCRQCCKDNNCTKDPTWLVLSCKVIYPTIRDFNITLQVVPNHSRRMGLHWIKSQSVWQLILNVHPAPISLNSMHLNLCTLILLIIFTACLVQYLQVVITCFNACAVFRTGLIVTLYINFTRV